MIDVSVVGGLVYIRHKHKVLSSIFTRFDYDRSMPENLIEPGLISIREFKKIKAVKFFSNKDYTCYYKDKQFWIKINNMAADKLRRELWRSFKDTGECWFVPADYNNRAEFFATEEQAKIFVEGLGRMLKPRHINVKNPEDFKCIVKMPWVSMLLEDYDIAKEWNEYTFDNFEFDELSDWLMIIKAFREWENNDKS